jgi:hypothetical protein
MKRTRVRLIFSVMLTVVLLCSQITSVLALDFSDSDVDNVKKVIQSYFDQRSSLLSTFSSDSKSSSFSDDSKSLSALFAPDGVNDSSSQKRELLALNTRIEHYKMQSSDLRYIKYNYSLEYNEVSIENNLAKVSVLLTSEGWFKNKPEPEQTFGAPHMFYLKKNMLGEWKIVDHEYDDDFVNVLNSYSSDVNDWDSAKADYIEQAKETLKMEEKAMISAKESGALKAEKDVAPKAVTSFALVNYNRTKAVTFADDYVSETEYPAPYKYYSVDCTNFTSICLKKGGIVHDEVGTYVWYFKTSADKSAEFAAAKYFGIYADKNVGSPSILGLKSTEVSAPSSLDTGDIVQLYYSDSGEAYHSMIILRFQIEGGYKTDAYIAQHTSNGRYWLSTKPSPRYYRHIVGSYK